MEDLEEIDEDLSRFSNEFLDKLYGVMGSNVYNSYLEWLKSRNRFMKIKSEMEKRKNESDDRR